MLLTTEQLTLGLQTGTLFDHNPRSAALRAYAQASSHVPFFASILDRTAPSFKTKQFQHWVDELTRVNNVLTNPIEPSKTAEEATLLDYLKLEELIIYQYIQQVNARSVFSGLYVPSPFVVEKAESTTLALDDYEIEKFIIDFSQYAKDEEKLLKFVSQPDGSRLGVKAWEQKVCDESSISPSLPIAMLAPVCAGAVSAGGTTLLSLSADVVMCTSLTVAAVAMTVSSIVYHTREARREAAYPAIINTAQKCFNQVFLKAIPKDWNNILTLNSTTFEQKWMLRSYFYLMHKKSVGLSDAQNNPKLLLTAFTPRTIAIVAAKSLHHTAHDWLFDNAEVSY